MALINHKILIIRGINLSSFYGLNSIWVFQEISHVQPENLSSCHGTRNIQVFYRNRIVSEIICLLTPILQGGIALFAIFQATFRFFQKTARNGKESVVLPYLRKIRIFQEKSLISRNNLSSFYEMICDRMFSEKSHDSSCGLMSSRCVGNICHEL